MWRREGFLRASGLGCLLVKLGLAVTEVKFNRLWSRLSS
uniref:Uncharacterized protein n=1 Tax=Anguilla anguilla TaxID=7936 RepID=A0A0E9WUR9_ANGAN